MTGLTTEDEGEPRLLHAVSQGDEAAFRLLYRRHTPRMYGLVRRLLGPGRDQAEDVVQEAWLRAVKGLTAFRGDSRFSTWLCGIAARCAMEAIRRHTPALEHLDLDCELPRPDLALDLDAAIAALAPGYRTVLVLHDIEGRTHAEIAALLAIDEGTSKSQLSRARKTVRARLRGPVGVKR